MVTGSGLVLLWVSGTSALVTWSPQFSAFVSQVGGLFVATGSVTFVWDLWGKRQFAEEVLALADLSKDLQKSGVERIGSWFDLGSSLQPGLFLDAKQVDFVLA